MLEPSGFVTVQELKEATKQTRDEIWEVKRQLRATVDSKERRTLERRLKELQYLQLWQLEQLGWDIENLCEKDPDIEHYRKIRRLSTKKKPKAVHI